MTTSNKTLKEFFSQSSNPNFYKKVWKAGGLDFSVVKKHPSDYYAADTGAVPGMIYYSETEKFAKNNADTILDIIADYDDENGSNTLKRAAESGSALNFFAWFAWESMMCEMLSYLED